MRVSDVVALLMTTSQPWKFFPRTTTTPPMIVATGTRNVRDLLDDIDIRGRTWPPGLEPPPQQRRLVHRGISGRTLRMCRDVENVLLKDDELQPLLLAGWSLGGGSVLCLASHLIQCDIPIHSVYTFGAPCIANDAFVSWYDEEAHLKERTWRYVTPRDPIPRLKHPLYKHVGQDRILIPCTSQNPIVHHDLRSYYVGLLSDEQIDRKLF